MTADLEGSVALVFASVLLALRIGPAFAFAPPFTLARVPVLVRVPLALGLSACMVGAAPEQAAGLELTAGALVVTAARELMLGAVIVLVFQLVFGAIYLAGRTVDIQAGFGLAMLIDPTTRSQTPLVGTLFAYAAGSAFFAMDGHAALARLLAETLDAIPLGTYALPGSIDGFTRFLAIVTSSALGVAGGVIVCLLLADLALTALSRTVPQMNVLVLGLQLKTMLLLVALPLSFGVSAALLTRLMSFTLENLPGLL